MSNTLGKMLEIFTKQGGYLKNQIDGAKSVNK